MIVKILKMGEGLTTLSLTASHEEYVKAIFLISKKKHGGWVSNSEISDFLQVKPSSVSDMLYKLSELDLISWKPRKSIRLTEKGKLFAMKKIECFLLLKDFFMKYLIINDESAINSLCSGLECKLTPELIQALKNKIKEE